MPCFHPLRAWRATAPNEAGKRPVGFTASAYFREPVELPCGRCIGCRLERTRQWAVRCMHEASLHEDNCFLTLTYDKENLPRPPSVDVRPLQLFFKRLRRRIEPLRISYFACGEYGDEGRRPHYHALVFGFRPPDCVPLARASDYSLSRSSFLAGLWQMGFVSVGSVSFESAAYVARYALKKITGDQAAKHYEWTDPETGEVHELRPEFMRCSLKPAVGRGWYERFAPEVLASDSVVARGREMKPPRYYDKLLSDVLQDRADEVSAKRRLAADARFDEGSTSRLAAREASTRAKLSTKKRSLQ